jgi:hypothetical protein
MDFSVRGSRVHQRRSKRFLLSTLMAAMCGFSALAEEDYFPFAVGQEASWKATVTSAAGKSSQGIQHRKIENTVELDGKTYFRFRIWFEGFTFGKELTMLNRKDEKAVYSLEDGVEKVEVVLPVKAGASWQQAAGADTMTVTVVGMEAVEIEGKTYKNCCHMQYSAKDGKFTKDYWRAPGIGVVKCAINYATGVKLFETLKDFNPGG